MVPSKVCRDVVLKLASGEPQFNLTENLLGVRRAFEVFGSFVDHGMSFRATTGLTRLAPCGNAPTGFGRVPLLLPAKVKQELPDQRPRRW